MVGERATLLETEQGSLLPLLVPLSLSITVLSTHIRAFILHRPPESRIVQYPAPTLLF